MLSRMLFDLKSSINGHPNLVGDPRAQEILIDLRARPERLDKDNDPLLREDVPRRPVLVNDPDGLPPPGAAKPILELLVWDLTARLGYRDGGDWAASLLEVLLRALPGSDVTLDAASGVMRSGFPWQAPEQPHIHLRTAEAWWAALRERFITAYRGLGCSAQAHEACPRGATHLSACRIVGASAEDTLPSLEALATRTRYSPTTCRDFGDRRAGPRLTSRICNSAEMGYEKPHPQAFACVLDAFPEASPRWMIGDNYHADVLEY